ncbi:N-terminal nucleophile aminohydrolase [Desarmillaria tabescens]|uniref:N-terminal nucleophile aminohydrolase n=1 Tax=Armillaria tabescens TaxID=1929756 RepID=A0AA39J725_ARMTA|nr:N-terminal nucleophile aminohydrolase [Desarmillaria tabescens]KAK0436650.1 N-terminal nucleophile aminohydrolase [Desarmillaria tabescens]
MCRFVIYKGTSPVQLSHVHRRRPMNGDGFGVGQDGMILYTDEELGAQPCIFTSVTPAWNNINLTRLAEKIKSPLVFGHVRATTAGSLSLDNCHPFVHGKLMTDGSSSCTMGGIADFHLIKRKLQSQLPDVALIWSKATQANSEWAFALFLSKLPDPNATTFSSQTLRKAMLDTIASLNYLCGRGWDSLSLMNFCVTDGDAVIATRYISSRKDEAASLWFSSGTTFSEYADGGHYKMSKADKRENIIMIASEPLTFERADWMEIKTNTMVVITPKMNLLQIPIIDQFYVAPSDPNSARTIEFAREKGLLTPRKELSSP